jgi:SAM-dependent methyltransferase
MKIKDYTNIQRQAWDTIAPVHKTSQFETLLTGFKQSGYSCLDAVETDILKNVGIVNKAVIQLACNNGRESLSIKNLGAGRCVGVDISGEFIQQGKTLAQAGNIDCEFINSDVYELSSQYDHQFDLVYITIGALCWMPDLKKFFDIIKRLLKPEGDVFIYDTHPIVNMLSQENKENLELELSYFRREPFLDSASLDYYDNTEHPTPARWWFNHNLSDIFTVALEHHLAIILFKEYPHDICNTFSHLENQEQQLPLSYTLVLRNSLLSV